MVLKSINYVTEIWGLNFVDSSSDGVCVGSTCVVALGSPPFGFCWAMMVDRLFIMSVMDLMHFR